MVFSKEQIVEFINDLIVQPRLNAVKWSKITNQTPNLKIGYPGQHLASLVTGIKGEGSGARGNDLEDGTEIKSCSRVDQLDKCKSCGLPVLRQQTKCPHCASTKIDRKDDSKWLFTIRSEDDLKTLTDDDNLDRVVLIIDDYPDFAENNFNDIRIQIFEIYPKEERFKRFKEIMTNYYYKIYLEHKKEFPSKTPAPKNFWPYSYQFYLCNPIKIFEVIIKDAYTENPIIEIITFIKPEVDRNTISSEIMPISVLTKEELNTIVTNATSQELMSVLINQSTEDKIKRMLESEKTKIKDFIPYFKGINEDLKKYLNLRDTDKIAPAKNKYSRRNNGN